MANKRGVPKRPPISSTQTPKKKYKKFIVTPIETVYKGYRFRSRLEARWAIFFDTLKMEWLYEPEGYVLNKNGLRYLPDFYLPSSKQFFEVKGALSNKDINKINQAMVNGINIVIAGDSPVFRITDSRECEYIQYEDDELFTEGAMLAYCSKCGCFQFLGYYHEWKCLHCQEEDYLDSCIDEEGVIENDIDGIIKQAIINFRSARFEFDDEKSL